MKKPGPKKKRKATKRRSYSDEFRAQALACLQANGGNVKRTAKQLGVPEKTLEGWAKGRNHPVDAHLRDRKTGELKDVLDSWVRDITSVEMKDVRELNIQQMGVAIGIAVDKILLLTNRPNVIADERGGAASLRWEDMKSEEILQLAYLKAKLEGRTPIVTQSAPLPRITSDDGREEEERQRQHHYPEETSHEPPRRDGEEPGGNLAGADDGATETTE